MALFACQMAVEPQHTASSQATKNEKIMTFSPKLQQYADSLTREFDLISEERKLVLAQLADFVRNELSNSSLPVQLTFICTHNSRRSHMGQIWAAAAAAFYQIEGIETYSGGTEATAFNPRAVRAMERAGFTIENPGGDNPHYVVHMNEGDAGLICYSKVYNDTANPQKNFAAIMTCSQADADCPFIPGAKFRLSLPYNDPKEADNTPQETERYDERCRQIGRELMYAFSLIKKA
jgi:arsenate reductase